MRILVDTSAWRRHLRARDERLAGWLAERRVVTHAEVVEELVLGGVSALARRSLVGLRHVDVIAPAEVLAGIDAFRLAHTGLGAVDAHLFLAAHRARVALYTWDVALRRTFAPFQPPWWRHPSEG